ncbi:uncharacterized protein [Phyllobates terribilis]|uniref:uncharacterized protein n=1 Tax=Phyllobates terribilis TaxID=111132 RepID=UPI003CCAB641
MCNREAILFMSAIALLLGHALTENPVSSNSNTMIQIINDVEAQVHVHTHCWDKDHDLGEVSIPYQRSFEFSVKNVIFGYTNYHCSFVILDKLYHFDIYRQRRDKNECAGRCTWSIKEDGPCLINPAGKPFDDCFRWDQ